MFIIIIAMQASAKVDEDNIYFDMVHIKISVLGCNIFAHNLIYKQINYVCPVSTLQGRLQSDVRLPFSQSLLLAS